MAQHRVPGTEGYPLACDLVPPKDAASANTLVIQERIDLALQISEGGIWDWEILENRCYFSPQWKRMLGYPESEALERSPLRWGKLLHEDDAAPMDKAMKAALMPQGAPLDITCRLRCYDGSFRWVRCRASVVRDASGRPVRVVGANHDLTQTRERRLALVRANEFSEKLVRSSVAGIVAFDTACNITAFNPAIEKIWGAKQADVLGKNVFECFGFLRESHEDCLFFDTLAGKQQTTVERPYRHLRSGCEGQYRAHYVPLTDDAQKVTGGLVFVTETSAQKIQNEQQRLLLEAGAQLARSLDTPTLLQEIVELAVPILCDWCVVSLSDPQGAKKETSFALCHRDGALSNSLQKAVDSADSGLASFFAVAPEQSESASEVLVNIPQSLIALLGRDEAERTLLRNAGFGSYVRVPLAARGCVFGMMVFVARERNFSPQNVTSAELLAHRAALALDNARLYAAAQEAVRVREDVLAMVSHDLKSPLQAITLQCDRTLRRSQRSPAQVPPAASQLARTVRNSAERLNRTIFTILDAARLEGGRFVLNRSEQPVMDVVREAQALMAPVAREREIELTLATDPAEVTLAIDAERISQALVHVVEHALTQAPRGSKVALCARHHAGKIDVTVEHEGSGAPSCELRSMLTRPWQGTEALSRTGGLGLYVAQQIVRAHGGEICVVEDVAPGATRLSMQLPATTL